MSIGPIMTDVEGLSLTIAEEELLQDPLIGGVILFTRNFHHHLEQLQELVAQIRKCRREPLLIAVDHEGGRIQRFHDGFTRLPSCAQYGNLYDQDHISALEIANSAGWLMASELLSVGIDMSFAPCLDLDYGVSEVIGQRSFHANPQVVCKLAKAFIAGMQQAGMQATGKHFPGHGAVSLDSHLELPRDNRTFEEIFATDILPYQTMNDGSLGAIMPAHIIYTECDEYPAGYSTYWLQTVLRQQLQFTGAIISDDLSMVGGRSLGTYADCAKRALTAGCDMILICNNRTELLKVLEPLRDIVINPASSQRLMNLRGRFNGNREDLYDNSMWHEARNSLKSLAEVSA